MYAMTCSMGSEKYLEDISMNSVHPWNEKGKAMGGKPLSSVGYRFGRSSWFLLGVFGAQPFRLFVTLWTVARQPPLSMGTLHVGILGWVTMPSSRDSSQPRSRTKVSLIAGDSLPSKPPGRPLGSCYHWLLTRYHSVRVKWPRTCVQLGWCSNTEPQTGEKGACTICKKMT